MNRSRPAAISVAVIFLALPAHASADDQSVWDAYAHGHHSQLNAAVDAYGAASDRMSRTNLRKPRYVRATIAAGRRVRRTVGLVADGVRAEQPSTPPGVHAKGFLLKSLAAWRQAMAIDGDALRAFYDRHFVRGNRLTRKSNAAFDRSDRFEARARALLRQAGVALR